MSRQEEDFTYRGAGVDIDAGSELVARIKPLAASTRRPEMLGGLGGFGALMALPAGYREPLLVSGTDGVGTKLELALTLGRHDTIGIDLVAMCVNDILTSGAEPLFFLDYYATGKLEVAVAEEVVAGIAEGCRQAGAALAGGETAEMPGMYAPGSYDLAGFCVGVVERSGVVDGSQVAVGDAVIGLPANGFHSNGYSLVRRVLQETGADLSQPIGADGLALGSALLMPTPIYVAPVRALLEKQHVKGMAHITGGGLPENLPRVLPAGLGARLDSSRWQWPAVYDWLTGIAPIARQELFRTFNCGIGFVLIVAGEEVDAAIAELQSQGQPAALIGQVVADAGQRIVIS